MQNAQYEAFCQLTRYTADEQSVRGTWDEIKNNKRPTFEANLQEVDPSAKRKKKSNSKTTDSLNKNILEFDLYEDSKGTDQINKFKGYELLLLSCKKLTEEQFK